MTRPSRFFVWVLWSAIAACGQGESPTPSEHQHGANTSAAWGHCGWAVSYRCSAYER